jgi:uncharacterized alpha/beta hydrolase family protein
MNVLDQGLFEAAKEINLPEIRRLLSLGADVNATNVDGETPLSDASYNGHVHVVKTCWSMEQTLRRKTGPTRRLYTWPASRATCPLSTSY